jgi:pantoate--beta-alanine ligase
LNRCGPTIVRNPAGVRDLLTGVRSAGARIGFVPTMGALHDGHASLIRLARERTTFVVVSIFVNPKQFGPSEDLEGYPRDEESDRDLLGRLGCDLLFAPRERDIYSTADRTRVSVEGLDEYLCGASRPHHFRGVTLVVAKLFNIVQPDEAYFGQKDAQQAVIIQRMAADLDFPIRIVVGPTVRELDGLAMSSRNAYLAAGDRKRAVALYEALGAARRALEKGERDPAAVRRILRERMTREGIDVDYAEIVDAQTLRPIDEIAGLLLIGVAARVRGTRLIDNMVVRVSDDSVEETMLEFPEWSRYVWKS